MEYDNIRQIPNLENVKARLKTRGLTMFTTGWEKHGPHKGQPYMVFIGPCRRGRSTVYVAVYPNRIYEIDNPVDWYKGTLLSPVKKKKGGKR